jgi:hypothetical protein
VTKRYLSEHSDEEVLVYDRAPAETGGADFLDSAV